MTGIRINEPITLHILPAHGNQPTVVKLRSNPNLLYCRTDVQIFWCRMTRCQWQMSIAQDACACGSHLTCFVSQRKARLIWSLSSKWNHANCMPNLFVPTQPNPTHMHTTQSLRHLKKIKKNWIFRFFKSKISNFKKSKLQWVMVATNYASQQVIKALNYIQRCWVLKLSGGSSRRSLTYHLPLVSADKSTYFTIIL